MNTESTITVSVTGDPKVVTIIEGLLRDVKLWVNERSCAFHFGSDIHQESVLVIHVHENLSIGELREICKENSRLIGHLINIVPEDDGSDPPRRATRTAALQVAHSFNFFCRYAPLSGVKKISLEDDILNSLYLIMGSEPALEKAFNIKRYLDLMVYTDEISLALAREGYFRKLDTFDHQHYSLYPLGLNRVVIPKKSYDYLRAISKEQNHLWMKLATDIDYLIENCEKVAKGEPFLQNLIEIAKKVRISKTAQTAKLCYSRNDFSRDTNGQFLQIESNMWGCGFGPIEDGTERALKHIESQLLTPCPYPQSENSSQETEPCLVGGLEAAWRYYGAPGAIIVMVSSQHYNAIDMFAPAKMLAEKNIPYMRYSFDEILDLMEFDEETGIFKILGKEVAVFYYRDGYLPENYTPETWKVREKMELSRAIKAPNISYQLANTKYAQHIMGKLELWEKLGYSEETFKEHSKFFPESHCLADFGNSIEKFSLFIEENGGYSSWVYKPQRDGGGHNLIDEDIKEFLSSASIEEAANYILQKRIDMATRTGIQTNWTRFMVRPVNDEMGLFYSILSDKDKVIFEKEGGYVNWAKFTTEFEPGESDDDYSTSNGILLVE